MRTQRSLTNRHIVLDLDSTLIHSTSNMKTYANLKLYSEPKNAALRPRLYRLEMVDVVDKPGSGIVTVMWGVFRPYVFEFLQFADLYFQGIHIWSAGQYKYVHSIKEILFRDGPVQPSTILTYDDCEMTSNEIFKPLSKFYGRPTSEGANETNTLALDDRDDTFSRNHHNGIQIPVYEQGPRTSSGDSPPPTIKFIKANDIALPQLMCWLSLPHIIREPDVRKLDKSTIFTTPLIEYERQLKAYLPPPQL
jgi:hypothetical protein